MIESIYISIYDDTLPSVSDEDIVDFAEKGSIRWTYDGSDDKFLAMMPSQLQFDMEVSIEDSKNDLFYDYLFTGNETRYRVTIHDQSDRILWQGFLLPEEYNEPYVTGTFFIHITATDGLGRLRGKTLSRDFYRARQSVIKTIAQCLQQTGLELDIYIDAGIENHIARKHWERLYLDAQQLGTEESPMDCYSILEGILVEIGSTLFQQNNRWYIIGLNKRGASQSGNIRKYNFKGENPTSVFSQIINPRNLNFYATPFVGIKAPYKELAVSENISETLDLFPDRLVNQNWMMEREGQLSPSVDHWRKVGAGTLRRVSVAGNWLPGEWDGEEFEQQAVVGMWLDRDVPIVPSYPSSSSNYITLWQPRYMRGGQYIDFDFVWDYSLLNIQGEDVDDYIEMSNWYDVTLNGNVIMSNRPNFPNRKRFLWDVEFRQNDRRREATFTVKVRKHWLENDGFINIKLYHGGTMNLSVYTAELERRIRTLKFNYRKEIKSLFTKRRMIDYTTTHEVSLMNAGSVFDAAQSSFLYQSEVTGLTPVEFFVQYHTDEENVIRLRQLGLAQVLSNPQSIFFKRPDSDFYEYIYQIEIYDIGLGQIKIIFPEDDYVIRGNGYLYIRHGFYWNPQEETGVLPAREKWIDTSHPETYDRLGNVVGMLYHNIYPTSILAMEGEAIGIIQPLDIIQFQLKNKMRSFVPVRIEIMPNENTSSVTVIEYKNEKVTGYE